jgi:hypothetical protein
MSDRRRLGVNLKRLVEDISKAYPNLARGLIRECIQNGIDADATEIQIAFDLEERVFRCHDNGTGMDEEQFEKFFIIAESSKDPTRNIGQYGWGKIPFVKAGEYAVIETRSDDHHDAMRWQDLEYWPVEQRNLDDNGTLITIHGIPDHIASELATDKVVDAVRDRWSSALSRKTIRVIVDDVVVEPQSYEYDYKNRINHKIEPHGKVKGFMYFAKDDLPDKDCGVAVNVFGQTVTRTLFGISHPRRYKVFGDVDADILAESKTSDHSGFRHTPEWVAFQSQMRRILLKWLRKIDRMEWRQLARRDRRRLRHLVRDLDSILIDLPELSPIPSFVPEDEALLLDEQGSSAKTAKKKKKRKGKPKWSRRRTRSGSEVPVRKGRFGIGVTFESSEGGPESWISGNTIVINNRHPAYMRAKESRQLYYHELKCCANELIKLNSPHASEESLRRVFDLQEKFFRRWAEVQGR